MRKSFVAIVISSCIAPTVGAALAETTKTPAVEETHGTGGYNLTTICRRRGPAAENPYSKADTEWHAYLERCGFRAGSEGNLIPIEQPSHLLFTRNPSQAERNIPDYSNPTGFIAD